MNIKIHPDAISDLPDSVQDPLSSVRLVISGEADNRHRQLLHLCVDPGLINELDRFASGPRSLLVELALRYMLDALKQHAPHESLTLHASQFLVQPGQGFDEMPQRALDDVGMTSIAAIPAVAELA